MTCKIGCGTVQDSKGGTHSGTKFARYGEVKDAKLQTETKSKSLWSRMTFRRSVSDSGGESGSDVNAVIGGIPVCLFGEIGEVVVFMEPLVDSQVQSLFKLGTMFISLLVYKTFVFLIYCMSVNFMLLLSLFDSVEKFDSCGTFFIFLNRCDVSTVQFLFCLYCQLLY